MVWLGRPLWRSGRSFRRNVLGFFLHEFSQALGIRLLDERDQGSRQILVPPSIRKAEEAANAPQDTLLELTQEIFGSLKSSENCPSDQAGRSAGGHVRPSPESGQGFRPQAPQDDLEESAPSQVIQGGRTRLIHFIKPRGENSTPGTLKAVQVTLVKPVAYLKYRVMGDLCHGVRRPGLGVF